MFGMKVVEMDQVIAEREQMSIPDIFAAYGEEYFRGLETRLLVEMQSRKNTVVSCGRGIKGAQCGGDEEERKGRASYGKPRDSL